ncbi:uncharacterized protein LOC129776181 [Toxorhynchites rutilus septentrionalis]|uniref:uncharacterized protein LOC129776181 n=1 Tax=Toxorhynchites rutilus septentrionalis TaxID=329112 RepID=UPI0024786527|nr:uncharacterized protein LOC129776181 [Toxorhynchites rutilus septentrionalis]
MLRYSKNLSVALNNKMFLTRRYGDLTKRGPLIDIQPAVREALQMAPQTVVALESTIVTHGMPYPHNLETALEVEQIVRQKGAVPATIAIVEGRIQVGLSGDQLARLAKADYRQTIKTSRRDLAYVLSKGLSGGTTVAGTLLVTDMVGIRVFATGGIGGVHRGGEHTMDVSADLVELGRTPVAVVSSGVKSILDIPRTLEYLETQGVCVASYKCPDLDFPAFYTRSSGSKAPYNLDSASEAARMISVNSALGLRSGFLIGVPLPEEFSLDRKEMDEVIAQSLAEADRLGIKGKEVTPFILAAVSSITTGRSLESNMALIKNNARVASEIAVELYRIENRKCGVGISETSETEATNVSSQRPAPVVIGGSIVDTCITVLDGDLKLDGATYHATIDISGGGVGRNIAEGIWKIYGNVHLISAVGNDQNGEYLKRLLPNHCGSSIVTTGSHPTANCSVLLDNQGECKLVVGDMSIHNAISVDWINSHSKLIQGTPLVIIDSNISASAMKAIFQLCRQYGKPVFFEPTDMRAASKPFSGSVRDDAIQVIRFVTPNLYELRDIAKSLGYKNTIPETFVENFENMHALLAEVRSLALFVNQFVDNVIVTLGSYGVAIVRKTTEDVPFFDKQSNYYRHTPKDDSEPSAVRFYHARKLAQIVNVSGAGDSFTSGFVAAMLDGHPESVCVNVGFEAACCALGAKGAVAEHYFDRGHFCWQPISGPRCITLGEL